MSKIFKLKKWLTLEETAKRLTASLQEEITVTDVLMLAVEKHLKISVLIEDEMYGVLAKIEKKSLRSSLNLEGKDLSQDTFFNSFHIDEELLDIEKEMVERTSNIFEIPYGCYDLPMIGAEALDVLWLYELAQNKSPKEWCNIEGPFLHYGKNLINVMNKFDDDAVGWELDKTHPGLPVRKLKNKVTGEFIDENNYHSSFYPADGLGAKVTFVFKRENIELFERSLSDQDEEQEMSMETCLLLLGSILNVLKNAEPKSKRWTQESLKHELVELNIGIKNRKIDDYFSKSNNIFKSKDNSIS